jgi:hypothetical protein
MVVAEDENVPPAKAPARPLDEAKYKWKKQHTPLKTNKQAQAFTADLVDQLKAEAVVTGFHVTGLCPHCGGSTTDVFMIAYVTDVSATAPAAPGPADKTLGFSPPPLPTRGPVGNKRRGQQLSVSALSCRCLHNHKGSPTGYGCGADWLIGAKFGGSEHRKVEFFTPTDEENAEYWQNSETMVAESASALTSVRATVANWQKVLIAILALLAVTATFLGRDAIKKIPQHFQWWVVGLALVAVAANAAALYLCGWAQLGFPFFKRIKSIRDVTDVDLRSAHQAAEASKHLNWAVWATASSLVAAFAATGVYALAPDATTKPKIANPVTVIFTDKSTICGSLVASDAKTTTVKVISANGTKTTPFRDSNITSLKPGGC